MRLKLGELEAAAEEIILAEEIRDGEVAEVSGVDQPATNRDFSMFKGMGFETPPVDGYEACLRGSDQPTPTSCEGGTDEDHNLDRALEPDFAGHDFEHDYAHAKKDEVFDRCVLDVIDKIEAGEITPDDPEATPEQVGFAICTEQGAGGKTMRKQEGAPAPPALGEAVELPRVSETADREDLVAIGTEQGLTPDQAAKVADAVAVDYGALWDPNLVLVPAKTSAETLVAAAAKSLGFKDSGPTSPLVGRNHWLEKIKGLIGVPDRRPATAMLTKHLRGVQTRQEELMSEITKSKDDLRHVVDALIQSQAADRRLLAQAMGIDLATIDPKPIAPEPKDEDKEPEPATAGIPAKSVKDVAAPPATAPGAPDIESRIARLESAIAEILQMITGASAAPSAAAPAKRASAPPEAPPARRFGAKTAAGSASGTVHSTILDMPISVADREQARTSAGIPTLARG